MLNDVTQMDLMFKNFKNTTGLLPIAIRGFTLLIYGYKSESSHIKVECITTIRIRYLYPVPLKRRAHYQMTIW